MGICQTYSSNWDFDGREGLGLSRSSWIFSARFTPASGSGARMAAGMFLKEWITMVWESAIQPMVMAAETLQAHLAGVLRWFKSGLANGLLEGINSLLQAANSKARGYKRRCRRGALQVEP